MNKRTTQVLKSSILLNKKALVLIINNLKSETILSSKAKSADWLFITPLDYNVSVLAERKNSHFEVKEVPEDVHIQTVLIGKNELSDEVKKAEAFVKAWLKNQIIN